MKDISPILRALGLAESDVTTYLNTLQHGPSTVVDLSKRTNLSRQAVYLSIDAMTERGLMSSIQRGKKRYFTAEPPTKLLAHAKRQAQKVEEHISDLEKAIPQLELQVGGDKPLVRLYEGREGVRAHIEEASKTRAKEIYEFADLDALKSLVDEKDVEAVKKASSERKPNVHGIYYTSNDKGKKPQHDHLPANTEPFKSNITVYSNTIILSTLSGKMHTIAIEDKHLAESLKLLIQYAKKGLKK